MRTDSLVSNYGQQVDKNVTSRHSRFLMRSINRISHFTSGMQEGIAYLSNLVNSSSTISSSGTTEVSQYSPNNVTYSSNTKLQTSLLQFRIDRYASKGRPKDAYHVPQGRQPNTFHPNKQLICSDNSHSP